LSHCPLPAVGSSRRGHRRVVQQDSKLQWSNRAGGRAQAKLHGVQGAVPGPGAGERAPDPEHTAGPKRGVIGVQVVVPRGGAHRESLLC
jgi:hypothetical protein